MYSRLLPANAEIGARKVPCGLEKLFWIALVLAGTACVSILPNASESIVIERSRFAAPEWTQLHDQELISSGVNHFYVVRRSGLFNLELGIRQAKVYALNSTAVAITRDIYDAVVNNNGAVKSDAPSDQRHKQLVDAISRAIADESGRLMWVKDIYYERVERSGVGANIAPGEGEYQVFVLVEISGAVHARLANGGMEGFQRRRELEVQRNDGAGIGATH
jgi:hypothetical protein